MYLVTITSDEIGAGIYSTWEDVLSCLEDQGLDTTNLQQADQSFAHCGIQVVIKRMVMGTLVIFPNPW